MLTQAAFPSSSMRMLISLAITKPSSARCCSHDLGRQAPRDMPLYQAIDCYLPVFPSLSIVGFVNIYPFTILLRSKRTRFSTSGRRTTVYVRQRARQVERFPYILPGGCRETNSGAGASPLYEYLRLLGDASASESQYCWCLAPELGTNTSWRTYKTIHKYI